MPSEQAKARAAAKKNRTNKAKPASAGIVMINAFLNVLLQFLYFSIIAFISILYLNHHS